MNVHDEAAAEVVASCGIEELLADLDLTEIGGGETPEEIIEALDAEDREAVEGVTAIEEAYDEQTVSTADVVEPEAPAAAKKARKPREAKTSTGPKAPRDLNALDPSVFIIADGVTDLEANKAAVLALIPNQKKIAEKFENVFHAVAAGKKPSAFVSITFDVLRKNGSATTTELVAALKTAEYSEGTARSQAGQMMALFSIIGVASRNGQNLTFNADAPMSKKLASIK